MFTDIVGSTALMAKSEAEGLRAKERHRALVRPLVERYHGDCIEAKGDESLSVFPSALDAVNCALAIEAELLELDLKLHIGIHLGDISLARGEISGDGVNIAARVCALSEGGGICVSDEVLHAVRNQPDIDVTPLGERELKNVGRPVPVFALTGPAAPPSRRRSPRGPIYARAGVGVVLLALVVSLAWLYQRGEAPPGRLTAPGVAGLADRPAIAVLPFENLTGDPEQRIFADGLAEDLITRLGSWRSFPVIARASSFNPDLPKDVQKAGYELRAHYVVVGSVRKAGERIRVNVQLIDSESGRQVWANQYDRDFRDLLALQDEITATIIGEVNPDLLQF
jgi:adenylate cyclase